MTMKKNTRRILIVLSTLIIGIVIISYVTWLNKATDVVVEENKRLEKIITDSIERFKEDGSKNILKIEGFADADWDTIYIIEPYTNLEKFIALYDLKLGEFVESNIEINDGINLLLLTKKGEVVSYLNHQRAEGDFTYLNKLKDHYKKENAVFYIKAEDEWVYFSEFPQ